MFKILIFHCKKNLTITYYSTNAGCQNSGGKKLDINLASYMNHIQSFYMRDRLFISISFTECFENDSKINWLGSKLPEINQSSLNFGVSVQRD